MSNLKIKQGVYKVGINEVEGLKEAMTAAMRPAQEFLKELIYWNDCKIEETEYLSRDGFLAYAENCGGVQIMVVIPKCEEYEFDFLEFGECDDSECDHEVECMTEAEGHLNAKLRIWLKFEGIKDDEMHFYLYAGGGNGDAPYFRVKYEATVFESEFTAKSIAEFRLAAKREIVNLLKKIGGAA